MLACDLGINCEQRQIQLYEHQCLPCDCPDTRLDKAGPSKTGLSLTANGPLPVGWRATAATTARYALCMVLEKLGLTDCSASDSPILDLDLEQLPVDRGWMLVQCRIGS